MKRVILFFIAITLSLCINAQTIQHNQMSEQRAKCYQAELQKCFDQQKYARQTILTGIVISAIGGGLAVITPKDEKEREALTIISTACSIGGVAAEVVGLSIWLDGYEKARTLKLGYITESGGIGAMILF